MTPRDSRGFSLIEISVVIMIMGIVTAVAVLGTQRMVKSSRLVGAANTMYGDLRYAHSLATRERRNVTVVFQSGRYSVVAADTVLRRSVPKGVTYTSTGTATFYPWGLAVPRTITFTGNGNTRTVRLLANGNVTR